MPAQHPQYRPRQRHAIARLCLGLALLLPIACGKDTADVKPISLLGISVNGLSLVDETVNVPLAATFELTFSAGLAIDQFESAFSLTSPTARVTPRFSYSNASSKAIVTVDNLDYNTRYLLQVAKGSLGQRGEVLDKAVSVTFTTVEEGEITEMAPCISASNDCLQTVSITDSKGEKADFDFYGSYPIYTENARWKNLRSAVIAIHGQNRDADNYFSYLMTTLRTENLADNTVLLAPYFKSNSDAGPGDLHWTASGWREGQLSGNANAPISSFEAIDRLIDQLADKERFPALKKIIITGHSSGGLFTQVYAAANRSEDRHPDIGFEYVVANSQYFFYPDDVRYNEETRQFFTPVNCPAFNRWPLGFVNPPAYLAGIAENVVDRQVIDREVTYLLGNGSGADGTFNTDDCEAVLLGSSRFMRGANLFLLLETSYPSAHNSRQVVVNGVGHDGQAMYQSPEFRKLLQMLAE